MDNKYYCIPLPPLLWTLKIDSSQLMLPILLILAVFCVYFAYKRSKRAEESGRRVADKKFWNILFLILAFLAFITLPFNSGAYQEGSLFNGYYEQQDIYLFSYAIFFGILLAGQLCLKFRGYKTSRIMVGILIIFASFSLLIAENPSLKDSAAGVGYPTKESVPLSNSLGGCGGFRLW